MKHFIFSHDAEEAAVEFAGAKGIHFDMIPYSIGANVKFWVKLVELNPEFIARVPKDVLEQRDFAENVDHLIFYSYLPKRYLTAEDYNNFKSNPEKAISVSRSPVKLSRDNDYSWYCLDSYNGRWIAESSLDNRVLLGLIIEGEGASRINSELWTQDFCDYLWQSPKAMVAYKDIPEEYVRQEWRELMDFFKKKRYPAFGYARSMEECKKLPEYWGSFKNEKDMLMALKCEELVQRCENPFGYAERLEFNPAMANLDFAKIFADLWEAIKDVAENNQVILKGMFDLYNSRFSACIPKKLFDLEWLINDELVEFYVEDYRDALLLLSSADCDVEKMEAEDRVTARLESLKEVIGKYVSLEDEEIDSLIATIV